MSFYDRARVSQAAFKHILFKRRLRLSPAVRMRDFLKCNPALIGVLGMSPTTKTPRERWDGRAGGARSVGLCQLRGGLAFGATLGACVLAFLDVGSTLVLDFTLPMTLYLFVVAIGPDSHILMAARPREKPSTGSRTLVSTRIAIANDAPTVAAAGVILAHTFASLMLTGLANLMELGSGWRAASSLTHC